MTADTVHTIFLALPNEEQKRLYKLISSDINKTKAIQNQRKKKTPLISKMECRNYLLETVFKVKLNKS
ncbi:hypothetical protein [Lutibacter sp.]